MAGKDSGEVKKRDGRLPAAAPPERPPRVKKTPRPKAMDAGCDCARPDSALALATCLDQRSGLYHPQHFQLSLNYEFNRMQRTEKPLGLIIVRLSQAGDDDFRRLGGFLKSVLRPLDLAARLDGGEVAILAPEADRDQAVKLIQAFARELEPGGRLSSLKAVFGAALARPYQGGRSEDLVQKARDNIGPASEAAEKVVSGANPWTEVDTALAGPERDSLFDGFGSLSLILGAIGRRP
jgi:GGDEF domain-containing protein